MAFGAKVGSFVADVFGNKAITSLGFTPKAVIFFSNGQTADVDNGNTAAPPSILGFAISGTGLAFYSDDDYSGGDPRTPVADSCVSITEAGGVEGHLLEVDFVSMDSDGFTVDVVNYTGANRIISYLALGGTDLTNAFIKALNPPILPNTGNVSYTGVGFRPDAILMLGGRTNVGLGTGGIGWASGASNRCTMSSTTDGAPMRYSRTDKVYAEVWSNAPQNQADFVSFDADGFTLNWDTLGGLNPDCYVLCLKGGRYFAGSFTQKTSTGTQGYTGVGFTPKAILFGSVLKTSGTTIATTNEVMWMIGATSGTTARAVMESSGLDAHPVSLLDRTKVFKCLADDGVPTVQVAADLSSFDSDGFTLNYTTADATAREVIYMAFGDAPAAEPARPRIGGGWNSL